MLRVRVYEESSLLVSPSQTVIYVKCHTVHEYMKFVFFTTPRTVSESCSVIFGLSKFSRTHLMRGGEQILKYLREKCL
jgi:hypothetical protein